ncbi:MAG: ROK family protein, partial [Micromonosporaceae bacterium]
AQAGHEAAGEIWRDTVAALADGLLTAVTLYDPELIVLGGGLAEAGDHLLLPLTAALAERVTFEQTPVLVRAALGDQAGCLGAALLAAAVQCGHRTGEGVPR